MSQNRALFDIKPVDDSGSLDVERISAVQPVVNLAVARRRAATRRPAPRTQTKRTALSPKLELPPDPMNNRGVREEFESALNENTDLHLELAKFGVAHRLARLPDGQVGKPRYKPILKTHNLKPITRDRQGDSSEYEAILAEIHRSRSAAARAPEVSAMVALAKPVPSRGEQPAVQSGSFVAAPTRTSLISKRRPKTKSRWLSRRTLVISAIAIIILAAFIFGGWGLKRYIASQGESAIMELQNAKADLEKMDFESASEDFIKAYQNFAKAGDGLDFMGATISGLIASLPGGSSVKSVQNLVQIGKLLADSGAAMTEAAKVLANAGQLSVPGSAGEATIPSVMMKLHRALAISAQDIDDIKALLADTDAGIIPSDKKEAFQQLSALVPTIEEVVGQGADYAKFFADATGQPGTQRYLILFENSSELRPTGGFPGSYGVVTFKDGKLEDFFVGDVYDLDGQIKEPIVPPGPLRHITPDWGMRDANWFADFPTSARVIKDFYKMESGQPVQGVMTVNPSLVTDILKIIGPVAMPQYNLTLDADNFVPTIQNQVEYIADRTQPKQVLKDFAPVLLEKLRGADSNQWLAIFNSVIANMNKNAVLMYFDDLSLETFADDQGFAGQVWQGDGDYVMPVISNIKGSKGDAVTDTSFSLETKFEGSDAVHTLTITRTHNGGQNKYAFYNKRNPAYVRVLVPSGTELISIEGNDEPNFQPLLNYAKAGFANNDTLLKWETSAVKDTSSGVTTYKESGRAEFGFWLITDAGKTKTVTLKYRVPNVAKGGDYNLYFQKQPGLIVKNASIKVGDPDASVGAGYSFSGPLEKDLPIKIQLP